MRKFPLLLMALRWVRVVQVNTDPHSTSEIRANGPLSDFDEFAAAFDVPEGAPMHRAAAERITIW